MNLQPGETNGKAAKLPARGWAVSLAFAIALGLFTSFPTAAESPRLLKDPSGIELVSEVRQARPTTEDQAQAWHDALQFAMANPDDVGYPWIDPATGTLELSAATEKGRIALDSAKGIIDVPNRVRDVRFSYGELETIKHDATTLVEAGVPDAELIYATAPDDKSNRVIITIRKLSEPLLKELAARYGTEAIGVRVDPDHFEAGTGSRQADVSPFYGGAKLYVPNSMQCTSGFSWYNGGGTYGMVTAGHCAPNGGSVSTPASPMGAVTANSEENWSTTYGTTYITGQSVYRGDVALIHMTGGRTTSPRIYRFSATSTASSPVISVVSRSPAVGDGFYTGGMVTGELSGWTVSVARMNKWYAFDGPLVWARNVTEGTKSGACIQHGDSGGSVFKLVTGGVRAVGIISGMGLTGCYVYFTDIWLANDAFVGYPMVY